MSALSAFAWGGLSSASLYLGQLLAKPMAPHLKLTGLVMGFGAGTLLSAVAYELIPEQNFDIGWTTAVWFFVGALVYYVGDRLVDQSGGKDRQSIDTPSKSGSGMAMFLGALLDGIPEAFILGLTLALGGSISVAFLAAVFVSNIPQGVAGTTSLKAAGASDRRVFKMWTALTVACALAAMAGYLLADMVPHQGIQTEAFAAGAVLTMLANSMMPEAFEHGGRSVGLLTVLGYLTAAILTAAG